MRDPIEQTTSELITEMINRQNKIKNEFGNELNPSTKQNSVNFIAKLI